jgi:MerR family transcriptional regulator, redox-sensitive transcriptional activator SoxR
MIASMAFTISQIANQIGLRPSAIRYYEQIGILPPAQRVSGQRRYDASALHRLMVIERARQTGFSLTQIKQLFFGFHAGTPPSVRWHKLKKQKIVELDVLLEHIQSMRDLLQKEGKCRCLALEECGKRMFEKQCANRLGERKAPCTRPRSRPSTRAALESASGVG